jgi:hypothetical protein
MNMFKGWSHFAPAVLIGVLGSAMLAAPAWAEMDKTVRDAVALEQSGKAGQAYALLAPLAVRRAGDPDFDYVLGLAALDSGHVPQAIVALQRVLAVQPTNGPARAEIARAYAMSGDIDTAKREFNTVSGDASVPDPVRQRFNRIVKDMDKSIQGGVDVSGFIEGGGGYDSNINAATSANTLVIPLFAGLGPATLSSGATRQGDGFGQLGGGVSVAVGLSRQSRVFASVLASDQIHFSESDFDQAIATATVGYSHSLANHDVASLSLQSQHFWLGGDHFREANGVSAQFAHLLGSERALTGSVQYFKLHFPSASLRDADRTSASLAYSDRVLFAAVQAGRESVDDPLARHMSNDFGGVRLAAEHPLSPTLILFGNAAYETRSYGGVDPLFLATRRDNQWDVGTGLRFRVQPRTSLSSTLSYTRNSSNISLNQYDRFTASVSLRSEF